MPLNRSAVGKTYRANGELEVSREHATTLSGRVHGEGPFAIEGTVARGVLPVLWLMANHVLTERTPVTAVMTPSWPSRRTARKAARRVSDSPRQRRSISRLKVVESCWVP